MLKSKHLIALGFDFGMKRIGVAIGQSVTQTANPLTILQAIDGIPNWEEIDKLIHVWNINVLIVGLPCNMDGTEQDITLNTKKFANRLKQKFKLPLYFVDERLTTQEAIQELKSQKKLKERSEIDSYAAKIILESWLKDQGS